MTITELSIKRPALVSIVFIALAVMGLFGYSKLGVDLLPKMDFPFVSVLTYYPGAGPEEVEDRITKPIEGAIAGTSQLDNVKSFSFEGYSLVLGQYLLTANADEAAADAQRHVDLVRSQLPQEALAPKIIKNDIGAAPILRMTLTSAKLTSTQMFQLAKDKLKTRIESVEGVAQVDVSGGQEREIKVAIDNDKLRSYNISINQIAKLMQTENLDFPSGSLVSSQKESVVRVKGKFETLDQIRTLPVMTMANGGTVHLGDLATISDTYKEEGRPVRLNGQDAVGLQVIKQSDANSTATADRVRATLKTLEDDYKDNGIKFTVAIDATEFTRSSLLWVGIDLLLAIIFVTGILFLFLHSFKNALIVLISIPVSLVTTFIFMWLFGFTLNLMSTMALSLVIGILVDDSIVVLENIHRKLEEGLSPIQAAIQGRNEIGFAALAITLVDVVVFLPISLVQGMAGKIFREFGFTVVISTLISLLVSFTLTPLLASRFSKAHEVIKVRLFKWMSDKFERFQDGLEVRYRSILGWALNHRKTIVASCFLAFLGSCGLVVGGKIGSEFFTQADRGEFAVNFAAPSGTNIEKTDSLIKGFEARLAKEPNIERYLTIMGKQENAWGSVQRASVGQIQVKLVPPSKRSEKTSEVMNRIRAMEKDFPGLSLYASPIGIFGSANQAPLQLELRGDDLQQIEKYAAVVMDSVQKVKGVTDLQSSYEEGQPEVKVVFDRERLATMGLTLDRSNARDVSQVTFLNHTGQQIKLTDVATIYYGKGPTQINRKNRERMILLSGNLDRRPIGDVVTDITARIKNIPRPAGVDEAYFGSDAENQRKSGGDLMIALVLAILFVYMIMVALFESYVHPFTIMFSLPVSLVGALGFLALFHQTLSMFTFVGLIMLMGLVTKNAILIVDRTNARRALGHGVRESLLEAGPTRLRPILMTTVTMILGMLPLATGLGDGGEMRQGMALAIVGGLISSMILSLVLVPVMFSYVEGAREKFPRFFRRINIFKRMRKPRPAYLDQLEPAVAMNRESV
jgi:HAE1 family hydrophobic/amphiphilic exporter-1